MAAVRDDACASVAWLQEAPVIAPKVSLTVREHYSSLLMRNCIGYHCSRYDAQELAGLG